MQDTDDEIQAILRRAQEQFERSGASERARREQERAEESARRAAVRQALETGRFPSVAVESSAAPSDTPAMGYARKFVEQFRGGRTVLVLLGGPGCGKTTAATWIARQIGRSSPQFVRAARLAVDSSFADGFRAMLDDRYMVVLDDLGVEYLDGKGAFSAKLDLLVDTFYGDRRPLVITSNLSAPDLKTRVGERVWSRLCECASIEQCGSTDLRRAP